MSGLRRANHRYALSMKAKHIPNIITSVRLFSALILLFLTLSDGRTAATLFLPLFIAAGISDMLDGYIARRFQWCTRFGANLDSISDLSLYIASATFLLTQTGQTLAPCLGFILAGAFAQSWHIYFALRRFQQFPAYHTNYSRLSAYIIFFCVIAFWNCRNNQLISLVAMIWTSCSIEGIIITALLKRARQNLAGIHEAAPVLKFAAKRSLVLSRLWSRQ